MSIIKKVNYFLRITKIILGHCAFIPLILFAAHGYGNKHMNVLLVTIDDLMPSLGVYGDELAITPKLDALAGRGFLFERAYAEVSVCGPSRTALMTGLRAETTGCYTNRDHFRDQLPDITTLPQAFRKAGYYAVSIGKTYDPRLTDPQSWDETHLTGLGADLYVLPENNALRRENERIYREASFAERRNLWRVGPAVEIAGEDDDHFDGQVINKAISFLEEVGDKPFFLAVGPTKPHLPFSAPRKYWDLYDRDQIQRRQRANRPEGAPAIAYHEGFELRMYHGIPKQGKLDDALAIELIHGYYACVSFVDSLVGRLIEALDDNGFRDNTLIVIWGDHGFHLGEKEIWCKFTTFDQDTRVPLIIIDPRRNGGARVRGFVESVDIYPTLAELAGVAYPRDLEGFSFKPLLDNPQREWKKAVFAKAGRGQGWNEFIGTSMRTGNYNYVEWRHRIDGTLRTSELYNLDNDPQETRNLADNIEYRPLLERLSQQMQAGYKAALPQGY
jgi:iduronate 2-sulfatase